MKKHAYLVMAHSQFDILITQIKLLDHENNDFYVHVDKKAKDVPIEKIQNSAKKSKVVFIEGMDISWGSYSQIESNPRRI